MNSLLTPYNPPAIVIILGFVLTIGVAWLLSYTRRGRVRPFIFGARRVRGPCPPVAALDASLPARLAVMKLRASRGQRVLTFLLDVLVLTLLILAGLLLAGWVLRVVDGAEAAPGWFASVQQLMDSKALGGILPYVTVLSGVLLVFLYYVVLEAQFGRTAGKFLAGTRVVDLDGCPITLGQAIGRTLCRRLPYEPVSLLFLNDKHGGRSAWHDAIPSTVVISTRAKAEQA